MPIRNNRNTKNSSIASRGGVSEIVGSLNEEQKLLLIKEILGMKKPEGIAISEFRCKLSGLEVIAKHLKEINHKSIKEISRILNRKKSTIYNTYRAACKKFSKPLDDSDSSIIIPVEIFAERRYSVLETIVGYMKDVRKIPFREIANSLGKSESTIRTVYWRMSKK